MVGWPKRECEVIQVAGMTRVDGPVDLGRERETIPIPEDINTIEGVMVHFNCNQKVAKASLARGYFIVDYNKRTVCPSLSEFDAEAAYRMVRFIYQRKFKDRIHWYIEAQDLIQEGVMRLLELSGHPRYREGLPCTSMISNSSKDLPGKTRTSSTEPARN